MITETSIYEYAKQGLKVSENKTALWFYGRSVSYKRLFEKIDCVADNLYRLGVRQGTVVTIHLPNCPQAVMAIYAVAKLGGICNMVHALTPKSGLENAMQLADSKVLVTYARDVAFPGCKVILADISAYMGVLSRTVYRLKNKKKPSPDTIAFSSLESSGRAGVFPIASSLASKCAVYLHSSGSTGKPKTIMLSHSALNNCVINSIDSFENGDMTNHVSLGVLPLFHGYGLAMDVHRNIASGAQLVFMVRWNAKQAVKLIKKRQVTVMTGVPTMVYSLLNEPGFCGKGIRSLVKCYVGGDNVKPELIEQFNARVGKEKCLYVGFGLTEATTTSCVNNFHRFKVGSVGYPVLNTVVAVLDDTGALKMQGEGELVISSNTLMIGYLNDVVATDNAIFLANGRKWVRTGDYALIDEDGFVFFRCRLKNIIVRNGYNIYPEQVEEIVKGVPGVADVCVVGVLDSELDTQLIRAVVIPVPGCSEPLLEKDILQECLGKLPRFSVPQQIVFVERFPQNAMGKIDRKELSLL